MRANQSIEEFGPIFDALGLLGTATPSDAQHIGRARRARREAAEQRAKLRAAIELKNYEFNAHGVELGQRYVRAVVEDGTPEPAYTRDPELYYHPTTWPGARLPHCWVGRTGARVSTLDLAGKGRFTLFTGIGGEALGRGRRGGDERTGVPIAAFVIGPGREVRRHLRRLGAGERGGGRRAACSCGPTCTSPGAVRRSSTTRWRSSAG